MDVREYVMEALTDQDNGTIDTSVKRKLADVDLNLLVQLEALLTFRNVTHAARKIGQTQPTVSRALGRLRDVLGDDLLVASSSGSRLTKRGEYLAEIVPGSMADLRDILSMQNSKEAVQLSVDAHLMPILLPAILKTTLNENRILKVYTHKTSRDGLDQLHSQKVGYLLGTFTTPDSTLKKNVVCEEEFVTLVSLEHSEPGNVWQTEETFLALTHVNIVDDDLEFFPQVNEALVQHGVHFGR